MSDVIPPQAGWYADPENPAGERWWNGSGWSDHKRDATVEAAVPAVVPAPAPTPVETGFTFGSPAPAAARPDPYAAPAAQPSYAAPASPYAPPPYGAPAGAGNGLAVAGLVVSAAGWIILGFLAAIAGIVLSGFGLSRARQLEAAGNPNSGRGVAKAGIIVGVVVLALNILFAVLYIVFLLSVGYES